MSAAGGAVVSGGGGGPGDILKQGWLTKKGHVRRNWKERWFVLQGTKLKYYEKPPSPSKAYPPQLGEIPLHKGSVAIDSSTQKDFMFTIQAAMVDGEKKNYLVKARTEQDMKEWIEAIGLAGKEGLSISQSGLSKKSSSVRLTGDGDDGSGTGDGEGEDSDDASLSSSSSSFTSSSSSSSGSAGSGNTINEVDISSGSGADELYRLKFNYFGQLSHLNMLRETKLCNVQFVWSGTTAVVGAHDYVLQIRASALSALVDKHKKKKKPLTVIDLRSYEPKISPVTLGNLLMFVYSDELRSTLDAFEAVRLLQVALHFELPRLVSLTQQYILDHFLTLEHTYHVLKEAHELGLAWAKEVALDHVHRHIKEFVKNKEEGKRLGIDLFQEVVSLTTEEYVPLQVQVQPLPDSTLFEDFKSLYDKTLIGESGDTTVKIQMQFIRFHRAVLSAHAKGFAELFLNDKLNLGDDVTQVLGVKKISPDAFRALLKFVYYGNNNVATTHACDIQTFADRMFMHDFQTICETLINSSLSHGNVLTVLSMTYTEANKDRKEMIGLRQKALEFCVQNIADIDISHISQFNISIDILSTWQRCVRAGTASVPPPPHESSYDSSSSSSSSSSLSSTSSYSPPPPLLSASSSSLSSSPAALSSPSQFVLPDQPPPPVAARGHSQTALGSSPLTTSSSSPTPPPGALVLPPPASLATPPPASLATPPGSLSSASPRPPGISPPGISPPPIAAIPPPVAAIPPPVAAIPPPVAAIPPPVATIPPPSSPVSAVSSPPTRRPPPLSPNQEYSSPLPPPPVASRPSQ